MCRLVMNKSQSLSASYNPKDHYNANLRVYFESRASPSKCMDEAVGPRKCPVLIAAFFWQKRWASWLQSWQDDITQYKCAPLAGLRDSDCRISMSGVSRGCNTSVTTWVFRDVGVDAVREAMFLQGAFQVPQPKALDMYGALQRQDVGGKVGQF